MNGSLGIMRGPEQHPQRFADYFVICGLDKDSGLEPDKYFGLLPCGLDDFGYNRFTYLPIPIEAASMLKLTHSSI